jgi:hypothetical protein
MKQDHLQREKHLVATMLGRVYVHRSALVNDLQVIADADERRHPIEIGSGLGRSAREYEASDSGIQGVAVGLGEVSALGQQEEPVDVVSKCLKCAFLALGGENVEERLVGGQSVHREVEEADGAGQGQAMGYHSFAFNGDAATATIAKHSHAAAAASTSKRVSARGHMQVDLLMQAHEGCGCNAQLTEDIFSVDRSEGTCLKLILLHSFKTHLW